MLRDEESGSTGGVISLTDSNFGERIFSTDRPYHKIVLFNTKDVRHNCGQCDAFRAEVNMVASAAQVARAEQNDHLPVFVFEADYSDNRKMFEKVSADLSASRSHVLLA